MEQGLRPPMLVQASKRQSSPEATRYMATLQMKGQWESNILSGSHLCNPRNETVQLSYFQNRIRMFCLPIPTLIYLWEIYKLPGSVVYFTPAKYVNRSRECRNPHECRNWEWGRSISFLGIHKLDFWYSVLGVNKKHPAGNWLAADVTNPRLDLLNLQSLFSFPFYLPDIMLAISLLVLPILSFLRDVQGGFEPRELWHLGVLLPVQKKVSIGKWKLYKIISAWMRNMPGRMFLLGALLLLICCVTFYKVSNLNWIEALFHTSVECTL